MDIVAEPRDIPWKKGICGEGVNLLCQKDVALKAFRWVNPKLACYPYKGMPSPPLF